MKVPNERVLHHVKQWLSHGDEDQEVTEAEAKRAIELAQKVQAQVRTALKQLGVDLPS